MPGMQLPEHPPNPGPRCGTAGERRKQPQNKAPARRVPKTSPRSFVSSQEPEEGFLCRSPGTERGCRPGSTAHGAVPGGSASPEAGAEGRAGGGPSAPLRHRWAVPAASSLPDTAAAWDLLHPIPAWFEGAGAQGEPTDQTTEPPNTRHHEFPGDATRRAASHTSGSNISYPELFLVSKMLRPEVSMTEQFPQLLQAAREPSEGSSPAGADGSRMGWLGDRRHSPPAPASLPP